MTKNEKIEYLGFTLEITGAFLSGDGCRITDVPDWVPLALKNKMKEYHAQDSVVFKRIEKFMKDCKKAKCNEGS